MKLSLFSFLVVTLLVPNLVFGQAVQSAGKVKTVVLDAGHGGKDPGTVHGKYYEKDVTLNVALSLGKMINENYPDVKVIYTRSTDVYVTLNDRGKIANNAAADLFISIHVDAIDGTSATATGATTYVMGLDKQNSNLDVAMRENDVIVMEEDYTTTYEGYIPGSSESFIIFSLMQYAYQEQSMDFAEIVQNHYTRSTPMRDRGARQAPYLVLWNTSMPSVLTELGYMSHSEDRAFLISQKGQQTMATALFNAFSEYKSKVEGRASTIFLTDGGNTTGTTAPTTTASKPATTTTATTTTKSADSGVQYYVQISTLTEKVATNSSRFGSWRSQVSVREFGPRTFKYYVGPVATYSEAVTLQANARKDFKDAFAVAFEGDKQLNLSEARKRTDK
ncbi:MAG: N-acetylmuramoyl-L-alanine amidase [Tidjanibacter sp.]|nr:N-acetylmuramoyl-L-alanine amidase [Tidjanibacter sp.]